MSLDDDSPYSWALVVMLALYNLDQLARLL